MPQNQSISVPIVPVLDLPRGIEDEFLRIEAAVPGYAGFFRDERGDIVVAVTNLDQSAAALAATAGVLDRTEHLQWRSAGDRADLRVRQVHYSFSQLLTWKNWLRDNATLIGIVELDADEFHNRVRLALRDVGYADHIRATAARLGIPDAALRIEIMSAQPRLDSHRVIDARRPTIGGIQIQRHSDGGLCSIGYHVRTASNQVYALTASHCTGNFTGGAIGQRWNQATTDAWGHVAVNPAWSTTGCAPDAVRCVDADAAAISYYAGVSGVTRVAETSTVGGFTAGNLTIGAQRDVAFPAQVVVGDTTFRTGRTSGTTKGRVAATCVDVVFAGGLEIRCLDVATKFAGGGDSGGAVYLNWYSPLPANSRSPTGTHVGHYHPPNWVELPRAYSSPWVRIEAVLGLGSLSPF